MLGLLALLTACPIDPTLQATGKTCAVGTDPCPSGWDCVQPSDQEIAASGVTPRTCQPSCLADAGRDSALQPNASALSPMGCHCDSDCPSTQRCEPDPYYELQGYFGVCEAPCTDLSGLAGCDDPNTVCLPLDGGAISPTTAPYACVVNLCGQDGGNGVVDGYCTISSPSDSTCLPLLDGGLGVCRQGTADPGSTCTLAPGEVRSQDSALCPGGFNCWADISHPTACYRVCAPSRPELSGCPAGQGCVNAGDGIGYCDGGSVP